MGTLPYEMAISSINKGQFEAIINRRVKKILLDPLFYIVMEAKSH